MTLFERFDQHKVLYSYLAVAFYLFLNNTINASSVWLEQTRDGSPSISMWEPFVWEYSSVVSTLVLLPFLFSVFQRLPIKFASYKKLLVIHLVASVLFSLAHVTIMVLIREGIYQINDMEYNFGPWLREFWYEYRKDAWGYIFFFGVYHIGVFVYSRLKGEANIIAENETQAEQEQQRESEPRLPPKHFLVKKLDKEFLVKVEDIEWIESSGNYVNLHSNGRIYPLRSTLTKISERLNSVNFSRIHRSFAVNHQAIDNISYQGSGDGEITLKGGKRLALSRRYKDEFKKALS